ncbi:MAG: FliH/SctL family protein [Myxococcota bacterium]|nr:FliH/SctL family protein [Myxococcota bacterium]
MGGPVNQSDTKGLRVEAATFGEASVVTDAPPWLSVRPPDVTPWLPQSLDGSEFQMGVSEGEGIPEGDAIDGSASVAPETEAVEVTQETAQVPSGPTADEHEAALSQARAEVTEALQQPYLQAAARLNDVSERLEREMDEAAIQIAVELASAILTREASADPEILRATVRRALAEAGPVVNLSLRVHPEDLEQTRGEAPLMATEISGQAVDLAVSAAADVDRGTCVVQFDRGIVDTRWGTQLRHLADAARQALEAASQETSVPEVSEEETP